MNLICPNCKESFEVNESHYAALLAQVKNAEFDAELARRLKELKAAMAAEEESRKLKADADFQKSLTKKEQETAKLQAEIDRLKTEAKNFDTVKDAAIAKATNERDIQISNLKNELDIHAKQTQLDIQEAKATLQDTLNKKEQEIIRLNSAIQTQKAEADNRLRDIKEQNQLLLRAKDEEIERYKEMKIRLSTKMLGETLEQHCANEFEKHYNLGLFANASFEKDNDTKPGGTKGDFIFRDFIDDKEYISIMFEMKNEADATATKHKNAHFFEKLDKDRREKNCTYAILVSMLEQDNEIYNVGIVNVPKYENMFVIRPQMFIQIITILSRNARQSAEKILHLESQLAIERANTVDVSRFEEKRNKFGEEFGKYLKKAAQKRDKAIEDIDKAIEGMKKQISLLENIKASFDDSIYNMNRANEKFNNDFTIKKLTHGNPTMKKLFEEANQKAIEEDRL